MELQVHGKTEVYMQLIEKCLDEVGSTNENIFASNVDIIEAQCLSKISKLDENFAFLSSAVSTKFKILES